MAHSKLFSPSSAKIWLTCTSSAKQNAELAGSSNKYAERGTRLHEFCEKNFETDWDLIDWTPVGEDAGDARKALLMAIELKEETMQADICLLEQEVIVPGAEECFGTADLLMYNSLEHHLLVGDYKFGYNKVEAEWNVQMMIYALGSQKQFPDAKQYTLAVIQPAADGRPSLFTISREELEAWRKETFDKAYNAILNGPTLYVPGPEQCRWCKSKATCPRLTQEVDELFKSNPPDEPDELLMSWEQRIHKAKLAKLWADAQEEELFTILEAGGDVPGFKLVRGRANRGWADEEAADRWLKSQGLKEKERYDYKLKSPAKVEKIVSLTPQKQKNFEALVEKPEGKLTWAFESDKRPAVVLNTAQEMFQAEDDEFESL